MCLGILLFFLKKLVIIIVVLHFKMVKMKTKKYFEIFVEYFSLQVDDFKVFRKTIVFKD